LACLANAFGDFYKKFGFVETGEKIDDEIVAELKL
jgi:hypothetical protein